MSPIERKWWFALPLMLVSVIATMFLLRSALVPSTGSLSWILVFSLCTTGLQRLLSFLAWLLLLWLAPNLVASAQPRSVSIG